MSNDKRPSDAMCECESPSGSTHCVDCGGSLVAQRTNDAVVVTIKGVRHHFWRDEAERTMAALQEALGSRTQDAPLGFDEGTRERARMWVTNLHPSVMKDEDRFIDAVARLLTRRTTEQRLADRRVDKVQVTKAEDDAGLEDDARKLTQQLRVSDPHRYIRFCLRRAYERGQSAQRTDYPRVTSEQLRDWCNMTLTFALTPDEADKILKFVYGACTAKAVSE